MRFTSAVWTSQHRSGKTGPEMSGPKMKFRSLWYPDQQYRHHDCNRVVALSTIGPRKLCTVLALLATPVVRKGITLGSAQNREIMLQDPITTAAGQTQPHDTTTEITIKQRDMLIMWRLRNSRMHQTSCLVCSLPTQLMLQFYLIPELPVHASLKDFPRRINFLFRHWKIQWLFSPRDQSRVCNGTARMWALTSKKRSFSQPYCVGSSRSGRHSGNGLVDCK